MKKRCLTLLLFAAFACGESNPVIGHWKVDSNASAASAVTALEIAGATTIEFEEDRLIVGSQSHPVTYVVEDDRVTATPQEGQGTVYKIESADRMSFETPMGVIV